MLKRTIKYTDFNDVEREEDFYFNLTKAEVIELELSVNGGLTNILNKIITTRDNVQLIEKFKQLILLAYGEKTPDGKRFVKSKELSDSFEQTEAYSTLFMELFTNEKAGADFVNAIMPKA